MNIAKAVLCNPNIVTPEMCIKIGQIISDALSLLKEQNNCENCAIAIEDRQPVIRCKDCEYYDPEHIDEECRLFNNFTTEPDWFCADGKKRGE